MNSIILKAPAKVNLYLEVINKRPDGYHNIETIFERINLCDWIKISIIPKGIKVTCSKNLFIPYQSNIVYKAARLLQKKYSLKCGFEIEINKRIPVGSGLGGGSSDAASTILGINKLLNINIKKEVLRKLATKIGADVAFFVSGNPRAFATGIGDVLKPVKRTEQLYFVVVTPYIKILTYSVYRRIDSRVSAIGGSAYGGRGNNRLILTKIHSNANICTHYKQNITANNIKDVLFNRLEEVVLPLYPVLRNIKNKLKKAGAEGILVSGSGCAVYGVFANRKEAVTAEKKLRNRGSWQLFLTSSY